ncbi:hypothetical protein [Nocardia sp. NPDC050710]|uniref:hypothetical protein n=1 Tax=Nocardia sp. NPDC050710 TaxID=3157220 RepID=UPI0033FC5415
MGMEYKGDRQRLRLHKSIVAHLRRTTGRPNIHDNTVVNDLVCYLAGSPDLIEVLTEREIVAMVDPRVLQRLAMVAASIQAEGALGQGELIEKTELTRPTEDYTQVLAKVS